MRKCYTKGANRTHLQDKLFLSDGRAEVLGRALSTGVNEPHSAMLCLNWLGAGLVEFAKQAPARPGNAGDPVLYRRVTFEDMLHRPFDEMRRYAAGGRTNTRHAVSILRAIAGAGPTRPLTGETYRGAGLINVLENLLPDADQVRRHVAERFARSGKPEP